MKPLNNLAESALVIYEVGGIKLSLPFDEINETVWATQTQIQVLFDIDQSGVSRHIRKIFNDNELDQQSNMQKMHIAHSDKPVALYSIDVILAVGYRANSSRATAFRRWATQVLKQYVIEGVAVNEIRLRELGSVVRILGRSSDEMVSGVSQILAEFIPGLTLLRDYDHGTMGEHTGVTPGWILTLSEARHVIAQVKSLFPQERLIGNERGEVLSGVISSIYQRFDGIQLYRSVEVQAANLLYLIVKDHPLSDGNKRSGAALFVTFLSRNGRLLDLAGNQLISNNALAAITLMVAMSEPREKELMISLIIRMLNLEQDTVALAA